MNKRNVGFQSTETWSRKSVILDLWKEANLAEQLRTITKASVELQMLKNGERTSRLVSETDYGAED